MKAYSHQNISSPLPGGRQCTFTLSFHSPFASVVHQPSLASVCHNEHSSCWSYTEIVLAQKRIKLKSPPKTFPVFFFFLEALVFSCLLSSWCRLTAAACWLFSSQVPLLKLIGGVLRQRPFLLPFPTTSGCLIKYCIVGESTPRGGRVMPAQVLGAKNYHIDITVSAQLLQLRVAEGSVE